MKKWIMIFCSCAMALILLTACGKANESTTDNQAENEKEVSEETLEEEENIVYSTTDLYVELLGAETYTKLEGFRNFVDEADAGHEFLVIYLEMGNRQISEKYFHYDYLKATLDGVEIENTFLKNNPQNYEPIFKSIPSESAIQGYLVYKVPTGWSNLSITYTGWGEDEDKLMKFEITPKDLKKVAPYVSKENG